MNGTFENWSKYGADNINRDYIKRPPLKVHFDKHSQTWANDLRIVTTWHKQPPF